VLLLTAMLVSVIALFAASTAEAHTLKVKKARSVATAYAEKQAQALDAEGLPVTRYGTLGCERRSAHAVDCIWAVELENGAATCAAPMRVAFRSRKSRRVKSRQLADPQCFDAEGNPLEKRALKRAVK
jgi:hypothetical protein